MQKYKNTLNGSITLKHLISQMTTLTTEIKNKTKIKNKNVKQ